MISYHFYPDTAVGAKRPSELAKAMQAAGYEVDIITARRKGSVDKTEGMNITSVLQPPRIVDNLVRMYKKIKYLILKEEKPEFQNLRKQFDVDTKDGKEFFVKRLRRWYFSCVALCDALKSWTVLLLCVVTYQNIRRQYGLVITSGPPMVVHNIGWLVKKIFRPVWLMDLRDPFPVLDFIYPEKDFMNPEVKSALRKNVELYLEKKCLHIADGIVTASPGIRAEILDRYPQIAEKIHVIYNGYDHAVPVNNNNIKHTGDKISFLYAGSLYFNRNPFPLLNAIKAIVSRNLLPEAELEISFYGDCEQWNGQSLSKWIISHDMREHVKLHSPVGSETIRQLMLQADVLINFCQGQPLQIPAKTFDYIGTGRKSLVLTEQDSASAVLMRESGCGIVVDPGIDNLEEKIIQFCKNLLHDRDVKTIGTHNIERYSRKYQNALYLELIAQCLKGEAK